MDLILTNEHIAVAQLCLRCWQGYLESVGRSEPQIDQASNALRDLEAMSPEHRLRALNVAAENDPELTIGTEDLTCILWTINHVMRNLFDDAPVYLQQVRQHFFERLCRQQDLYKTFDMYGDSRLATRLLEAYLKREKAEASENA